MATNGYARISGGAKLVDINPNKSETKSTSNTGYAQCGFNPSYGKYLRFPCCGYKKFSSKIDVTAGTGLSGYDLYAIKADGTSTSLGSCSLWSWTPYYDIPSDTVCILLDATVSSNTWTEIFFSMLA